MNHGQILRSGKFILQNVFVFYFIFLFASNVVLGKDNSIYKKDESPVAATSYGKVRGYVDNGIKAFKNIPYGDNTAARRFLRPLPPANWNGILDALEFGPTAPQLSRNYGNNYSEDCLRLNVWTPALRDGKKRPVMVWFHGGAYSSGTSNLNINDGARLAKRGDVVVVTVNHRLNVLGYLYLAEIAGSKYTESGNVGMLDLVLALKWVRDNIREFGGNPNNVLIFGQSGGGAKCATLMAMPEARGLFNKVITESGQQLTGRKRENGTATALQVLKNLNISPDKIEELNNIPVEKIIEASKGFYFGPVTDGIILPRDPFDPDASPLSKDIPMIIGNNHDETAGLIGGGDPTTFELTWETLPAKILYYVKQFIGNLKPEEIVEKYRKLYPSYSASDVFFAATTAARSWKGAVIEAERRVEQNGAPTYVFQFDWRSPVDGGKWKASHGTEISFVFDNVEYGKDAVGTGQEQQKMADIMSEVWIAFARTGNPDSKTIQHWPRFNLKTRPTMIFDLNPRIENDPRSEERKFFAPVKYVQPGT